ncbi:uncharacterized protein LOC110999223 isoform X1 [Pieris rapae]|uniref:uncharacterized protein LOC110999223 isoform X1 n=2 Tax=Pieris rapae TaxID=64459 RepID=UPI001E28134B|nr:uncharacterized protein LOC110999223 isoform X1 [Pieris rapae]XP_022123873.2 uncharacterized protein LOC110999223 isoform X1 [Pieris rapae]
MPPNGADNLLPNEPLIKVEKSVTIEKIEKSEHVEEDNDATECDCQELGFGAGDAVFASVVVAPLVVAVWRSSWGIMELHAKMFPYAQNFILGILIHCCFSIAKTRLFSRSVDAWGEGKAGRWLRERVLSRFYTYIFIMSNVMHWRGGWGLMDTTVAAILPNDQDPHRPVLIATYLIVGVVLILVLRSARNLLASPYFVVTDGKQPTYIFTTRYQKSSKETALYILDCVFSVTVVGSLVVFVWRGLWALIDIYLYPDDPVKSCWTSLIVGYSMVVVTFSLQAPMRWVVARLQGAPRLLIADVYHLLSFASTVNVWRGVWGLLDIYFLPDSPLLSNWSCHIVSLALLILLNCSNSILVRGVYIDAEEPAGECVIFPCHYLRLFFHKEKTKRHKALDLTKKMEEASVPLQTPEEKV